MYKWLQDAIACQEKIEVEKWLVENQEKNG
jgi:hypothetical protein